MSKLNFKRTPDLFIHAGGGTGLVIVNLGALIPGFLPFLALTALVTAVLVAPFVILGLAALLAAAPFYLMSRVLRRARRRRHRREKPPALTPRPIPLPHVS
jgi:membrane protein implicated in regulation of membrane protease activity